MSLYELLLFVHITAAIVWIGAGLLIQVQAARANKVDDRESLKRILDDVTGLSNTVFIPSSLTVVVFGVLMVIESDAWSFDQLWIVLGLIGYFATFGTGLLILKPRAERLAAAIAAEGFSERVITQMRELLVMGRIDFVVLVLVVFNMVVKPTGDDPAVLVAMAGILAAGTMFFLTQAKALRPSADAEASPASAAP
jgi:uncharacterized membrane protein